MNIVVSFSLIVIWILGHFYCFCKKFVYLYILQGMFIPAIKGQGTEEQQQKWLPLAQKMQIIGCYAQTELGHGSNVQGLETTASFDPQTDEFVINSPTLTSSKVSTRASECRESFNLSSRKCYDLTFYYLIML